MNYEELQRGIVQVLGNPRVTRAERNVFIIAARNAILADSRQFYNFPNPPAQPQRMASENASQYANRCADAISVWFLGIGVAFDGRGIRYAFENPNSVIKADTARILRELDAMTADDINHAEQALSNYFQHQNSLSIDFTHYGISSTGTGANTQLTQYAMGYTRAQTERAVAVEAGLRAREYGRLSHTQSTMAAGVDPSVQLSVGRLLRRYGGATALTRSVIDNALSEIELFLNTQSANPRYMDALAGFRTAHRPTIPYQHAVLGLDIEKIMALTWIAINDEHSVLDGQQQVLDCDDTLADPSLPATSPHYGKTKRQVINESIQLRKRNLMTAFAEFATEYGDHAACAHGTYNKIVETLSLAHPDVLIVQDLIATVKAKAEEIIQERFLKTSVAVLATGDKTALITAWGAGNPTYEQILRCRIFVNSQRDRINRELAVLLREEFPILWASGQYTDIIVRNELIPAILDGRFATVWDMRITNTAIIQVEDPETSLPEDMQELSYDIVYREQLEQYTQHITQIRRGNRAVFGRITANIRNFAAEGIITALVSDRAVTLLTPPILANAEHDIEAYVQILARGMVDSRNRQIMRYRNLLSFVLEEGFPVERAKEIAVSMLRSADYETLTANITAFLQPVREFDDATGAITEHPAPIIIPDRFRDDVVRNLVRIASTQLGIEQPEPEDEAADVVEPPHAPVGDLLGFDPALDQDAAIATNIQQFSQCALATGFSGQVYAQLSMQRPGDDIRRIACYGGIHGMAIPAGMPCVLPYEINGLEANRRIRNGIPTFSMAVKLPTGTTHNLPPRVIELLRENNVNINNLSVNVLVQDMPWQGVPLRLRSNPFTDPEATALDYNRDHNVLSGIADVDGNFGPLATVHVSTHATHDTHETIFSPPNQHILGIEDHARTHAFYSLNIEPTTGRAALTLHWLLNDHDHDALQQLMRDHEFMTLEQLINFHLPTLANSAINGSNHAPAAITPLQALRNLTVDGYADVPVMQGNNYQLEESIARRRELSLQKRLLNAVRFGFEEAVQMAINKGAMPTEEIIALARTNGNVNIERMLRGGRAILLINAIDGFGQTELHRACYSGDLDRVRSLLAAGANMDIRDRSGLLPNQLGGRLAELMIIFGTERRRRESISRIRTNVVGATSFPIDTIDSNGQTALHRACYVGDLFEVRRLLAAGARMDIRDRSGSLPDQLGSRIAEVTAIFAEENRIRVSRSATSPIITPVEDAILFLVDATDSNGQTALHRACYRGDIDEIGRLLAAGANMDRLDQQGHLPNSLGIRTMELDRIFAAERSRRASISRTILAAPISIPSRVAETSVSIDGIDSNGQTALHRACYSGNIEEVRRLLAVGARIDIRDRSGMLPNQLGPRVAEVTVIFAAESSRRASCAFRPVF